MQILHPPDSICKLAGGNEDMMVFRLCAVLLAGSQLGATQETRRLARVWPTLQKRADRVSDGRLRRGLHCMTAAQHCFCVARPPWECAAQLFIERSAPDRKKPKYAYPSRFPFPGVREEFLRLLRKWSMMFQVCARVFPPSCTPSNDSVTVARVRRIRRRALLWPGETHMRCMPAVQREVFNPSRMQ